MSLLRPFFLLKKEKSFFAHLRGSKIYASLELYVVKPIRITFGSESARKSSPHLRVEPDFITHCMHARW